MAIEGGRAFGFGFRTQSGTFMDGDLLVNRDGVRVVSQSEVEVVRFSFLISNIPTLFFFTQFQNLNYFFFGWVKSFGF